MEKESPLRKKSFAFALQVIAFYRVLEKRREYVLSKQLLRSGTSIGANIEEAQQARSRKDFASKLSIASQEAYESRYWILLICEGGYATKAEVQHLLDSVVEIIRILVSILKKLRE
jgi:four helix bundle protein